jgi:hypothetical protein
VSARSNQRAEGVGPVRVWAGALAAVSAWTVHFALTYPLVPLVCRLGARWLLFLIAGVTGVIAVAGLALSVVNWRALEEGERGGFLHTGSTHGFIVFLGLLASVLFVVAIVFGTVPIFFLDPCE